MEDLIEENITQPDPQRLTKIFFWDQALAWGGLFFLLIAVIIAVYWTNHRED